MIAKNRNFQAVYNCGWPHKIVIFLVLLSFMPNQPRIVISSYLVVRQLLLKSNFVIYNAASGAPPARGSHPSQIRPLQHRGKLPLLPPRSILQNPGKTAVLPVLPPMAPLAYETEDLFSLVFKSHNIFSNTKCMLIKENYK